MTVAIYCIFMSFCEMLEFLSSIYYHELLMQLPAISVGENVLDLVVIGCGPAGLALAAESAKLGLKVGLIGPDLPFTNNYGVWEDEFKGITFLSDKDAFQWYYCILFLLILGTWFNE